MSITYIFKIRFFFGLKTEPTFLLTSVNFLNTHPMLFCPLLNPVVI